jgi:hypothetical protein
MEAMAMPPKPSAHRLKKWRRDAGSNDGADSGGMEKRWGFLRIGGASRSEIGWIASSLRSSQ